MKEQLPDEFPKSQAEAIGQQLMHCTLDMVVGANREWFSMGILDGEEKEKCAVIQERITQVKKMIDK